MHILAVTNMYPTPRHPTSGTFVEQQVRGLRQIGMAVEVMSLEREHEGMRAYLGLRRRIRSRVAGFQPNLVHVMYGGVMADMITRAVQDRPTVVSFCGSDLLGDQLSAPLSTLIARYGVLASHRAARRAGGIVVKSKNLADALPDDVDRTKVRVIPNGVDLERFRPLDRDACHDRLGWHPDRFHVLSPSDSDPRSGCKRLDLTRAAVEAVKRLGIQAELHHLKSVPHDQVPVWLNASDVVLLTSLHEGSPNLIKEALACDLPIVSVDVGDVGERIQGIEGCHLALPEAVDLAAKLRLVHGGSRRVAGRVNVQNLSLERVALRLKEFYSEVLASDWKGKAS